MTSPAASPRGQVEQQRPSASNLTDRSMAVTWQCASLLLARPDARQESGFELLYGLIGELPPELGEPLARFLAYSVATDLHDLQEEYDDTFDARRGCPLLLGSWPPGNTGSIGSRSFREAYLASGFRVADGERPDHLSVVLEYAGTVDPVAGPELLLEHQASVQLINTALRHLCSPWADVVEAVCRTLPPAHGA